MSTSLDLAKSVGFGFQVLSARDERMQYNDIRPGAVLFKVGEASEIATRDGSSMDVVSEQEPYKDFLVLVEGPIAENLYIKKPVVVVITEDDGEYIGTISSLGIYAFCETKGDVKDEIIEDIVELFKELSGIPESKLGKEPRSWKKTLEQHIDLLDE